MNATLATLLQPMLMQLLSGQSQAERVISQQLADLQLAVTQQAALIAHLQQILRLYNAFEALCGVSFLKAPERFLQTYQKWCDGALAGEFAALAAPVQQGCPAWLDDLGTAELGTHWQAERAALALAPPRVLRANSLKCDVRQLQQALAGEGFDSRFVLGVTQALEVVSDGNLFRTKAFANGWFEQQDAGSQLVAAALPVQSGQSVIDACAGAGGKSLALAAQMRGKGRLLAMDVESWKLQQLTQRAKRAGAGNIETRLIDTTKVIKRQAGKAQWLMLDVPCSGSGVLRRNPDAKWRQPFDLPQLHRLQADILRRYSKMLAVGGELVYATCSIFPSENQQQVRGFLQSNQDFVLLDEKQILPSETGFDGFYWARLRRNS